jgi:hypothetical protein
MSHHQIAELSDQFLLIRLDLHLYLLAATLRHNSLPVPPLLFLKFRYIQCRISAPLGGPGFSPALTITSESGFSR